MKWRATCALVLLASCAAVRSDPLSSDRFTFSAGAFRMHNDTRFDVSSPIMETRATLKLEDDLGLAESSEMARYEASVRLTPRQRLTATWFDASRHRAERMAGSVSYGDMRYDYDVFVHGGLDMHVAEVTWRWAALSRERVRGEILLGVHRLSLDSELGAALADGSLAASARGSASGPLPVAGIALYWQMADRWRMDLQAQALRAEVQGFSGRITDLRAGIAWQWRRDLALGLYWNRFALDLAHDAEDWSGTFAYRYAGPQLALTMRF
ncbi:MAG TPA: hypothetical protein VFL14_04610 [Xanthomonadales bacterium]|nr:hypothetical protein [Xanthomonadales bacterium]